MAQELASAQFTTTEQRQELDALEAWAQNADTSGWVAHMAHHCPISQFLTARNGTETAVWGTEPEPGGYYAETYTDTFPLSPALQAVIRRVDEAPLFAKVEHAHFLEIVRQVRSLLA